MKTVYFSLILTLLIGSFASAQDSHHHSDHPSTHGMLMVGGSKIYLSHLPMFHTPHDYQVILEAQISAPAKAAYLASLAQSEETVYTLVPEVFVLPEMIENPKPFLAQIYKGHFERGGTLIASNVTVVIKVIYFKKFSASEEKPGSAQYILFGNKQEQFIAHSITSQPDFDQVLNISTPPALSVNLSKGFILLTFKKLVNSEPISSSGVLSAEISSTEQSFSVDIKKSLYLETGDLSF